MAAVQLVRDVGDAADGPDAHPEAVFVVQDAGEALDGDGEALIDPVAAE